MSSVDERVVEMKFNNQQFERGASQTIGTLDRLKGSLHFPSGTQMLGGLQSGLQGLAARGLHGIEAGVQAVGQRFTGLGVMGVTALATITNQAVYAGEQLVKSLTIGPISSGFHEYELEIKSIQTILANTAKYGTSLKQVDSALATLNDYADKTIYSFSDMTSNIGLFTNAGLRLEDSVSMIKGFSNAAAASGTNAENAARAAYQLSQALSAGTIRLMDWRSLTNAGMGNANMRRGLLDVAIAMGTVTKGSALATNINKDFNSSLEKGWLSAGVMSKYLGIMAGDIDATKMKTLGLTDAQIKLFLAEQKTAQEAATKVRTWSQLVGTLQEAVGTTWADTFRILLGNFNEATTLFTDISDKVGGIILAAGKSRNTMLQSWKDLGGRVVLINALQQAFDALFAIIKPIQFAFREIFPAKTGQQLLEITQAFKRLTDFMMPTQPTLDKIYRTARGFFAALDIGRMIIWGLIKMVFRLLGALGPAVVPLLDITATMGDWIVALRDALKAGNSIEKFFQGFGDVLMIPIDLLTAGVGIVQSFIGAFAVNGDITSVSEKLRELGRRIFGIGVDGQGVKKFFTDLGDTLSNIVPGLAPIIKGLSNLAGLLGTGLADGFKNIDYHDILDTINTGLFTGLLLMVRNFTLFGSGSGGIVKSITDVIHAITDTLKALQQSLKAKTIITIAIAMAILAGSVIALSLVDSDKLNNALLAMTGMYITLGVFTKVMTSMLDIKGIAKMPLLAAAMILFGVAFGVLTASVMVLARLKPDELVKGLIGLNVIMYGLLGFVKLIGPSMQKKMFAAALGIRVVALSITALSKTVLILGGMSWGELIRGLTGVAVLLGALVGYTRLVNPQKMIASGIAMNIMAMAVAQLAKAVVPLAQLEWGQLIRGLLGMTIMLGAVAGFAKLINPKQMLAAGLGLLVVGIGMKALASSLVVLAGIPLERSGLALGVLAGALIILAGAMKLMPPGMLLIAAGLYVVGQALVVIVGAVAQLSGISIEQLATGIIAMGAALAILGLTLKLMSGTIQGSAALVLAAFALSLLVPSIVTLSGLDTMSVVNALIALGGALLIMAGGLALMSGSIAGAATLLVAAAAVTILVPPLVALAGLELGAIMVALGALAVALGLLAAAGMLITPALPGLLGLGGALALIGIGVGLAAVGIGALLIGLAALVGSLAALAAVGPRVGTSLTAAFTAILNLVPLFIKKIGDGIVEFAKVIKRGAPAIVGAIIAIFRSFISQAAKNIPYFIAKIVQMIVQILETLRKNVPKMVVSGMRLLAGILKGIADNIGNVANQATRVIQKFMEAIGRNGPKLADSGAKMIINFVNGLATSIRKRAPEMNRAGLNLAKAIVSGMTDGLHVALDALIGAARNMATGVIDTVKAILGIHSPSTEFKKIGENVNEGFLQGLLGTRDQIDTAFSDMKQRLTDFITSSNQDIADFKSKAGDIKIKLTQDDKDIARQKLRVSDAKTAQKENKEVKSLDKRIQKLGVQRQKDQYAVNQNRKALNKAKKAQKDYTDVTIAQHRLRAAKTAKHPDEFTIWLAQKNLNKAMARHKDTQKVAAAQHKLNESIAKRNATTESRNDLKDARRAAAAKNKRGQAIKDANAQLTKMQTSRAKDAKSLKAVQDAQAKADSERLRAQAALALLNTQIATYQGKLSDLSDEEKTNKENLDNATSALNDAKKAREDYTQSIVDQYSALADVTANDPNTDEQITLEQYMKNIQQQTEDTIGFTKQLDLLRSRGLDDTLYEKFLSQGTEAMPFVAQLVESGKEGINQINRLDSALHNAAVTLGTHGANELKQSAIDVQQGLVNGFQANEDRLTSAMEAIGTALVDAINKKLAIKSPSRVFAQIGEYTAQGLANGLDQSSGVVTTAAAGLGDEAVSALKSTMSQISSAVSDNIDINPTIRPVLDLTDIQAGAGTIGGMFGNTAIGVNGTYGRAAYASNGYSANQDAYLSADRTSPAAVTFNQNNYSPKTLSASEIYRQTKNQISVAKGVTRR